MGGHPAVKAKTLSHLEERPTGTGDSPKVRFSGQCRTTRRGAFLAALATNPLNASLLRTVGAPPPKPRALPLHSGFPEPFNPFLRIYPEPHLLQRSYSAKKKKCTKNFIEIRNIFIYFLPFVGGTARQSKPRVEKSSLAGRTAPR